MQVGPENIKVLEVQKAFDSPSGKVLYEVLKKFTKPDIVQVPLDSAGRIDPLAVQYNEGKRAVMCHINALIKKNIHKSNQEKAELK